MATDAEVFHNSGVCGRSPYVRIQRLTMNAKKPVFPFPVTTNGYAIAGNQKPRITLKFTLLSHLKNLGPLSGGPGRGLRGREKLRNH
jgi:hypothetical protein